MEEVDRTRRVGELIKREMAQLISRELNDSRINGLTVTGVTVSRDLKRSTIFVSSVEENADPKLVIQLLERASKFLRRQLSQKVQLRVTPVLEFKYDSSIKRGVEMTHLISSLNSPRTTHGPE